MGLILLHNHCLQEGVRAVMDAALGERYGGRTALCATVVNHTVHSLFLHEFNGFHRMLPEQYGMEVFSMRWRDPLDHADYKQLLQQEFSHKPLLENQFIQWLQNEGWDDGLIHQLPLSCRHREFSRAFPTRWEQLKTQWRQTMIEQEWHEFDFVSLHHELETQFQISDQAPVCTVIKDVSK